jgi:hypothetical protein
MVDEFDPYVAEGHLRTLLQLREVEKDRAEMRLVTATRILEQLEDRFGELLCKTDSPATSEVACRVYNLFRNARMSGIL